MVVGAAHGLPPHKGASIWDTPENLWGAMVQVRNYRLAVTKEAEDKAAGKPPTIRVWNEDAVEAEED